MISLELFNSTALKNAPTLKKKLLHCLSALIFLMGINITMIIKSDFKKIQLKTTIFLVNSCLICLCTYLHLQSSFYKSINNYYKIINIKDLNLMLFICYLKLFFNFFLHSLKKVLSIK